MFQRYVKKCGQTFLFSLWAGGAAMSASAAWNGAGVAGGSAAATNINDAANWSDGTVSGDFSTIVSNAALHLTSDYTATNGITFTDANSSLRHVTVSGTNALTLQGNVPGFASGTRHLFIPTNGSCTVRLGKGLTLKLPGDRYFSGNGTLFIDALVSGAGGVYPNYNYPYGYQPVIVLRNDSNTFTGAIGGDCGRIYFTSIADKGVPSALGAGTYIGLNNFHIYYNGSRSRFSNRNFSFMNGNVGVINNSACGGLNLTGTVSTSYKITGLNLGGVSTGENLITSTIKNNDASSYVKLSKLHSGTWRLTGNNTFTGNTNESYAVYLRGGTLLADYTNDVAGAGSNRLFLAGRNVEYSDARLVVLGKTGAGNTTWQELGTNGVGNNSHNVLAANGNGGGGTTVRLNSLYIPNDYAFFRMERSGTAAIGAADAFPADAGSVRTVNGMLMSYSGQRANLFVKDPDGRVGFAAQNDAFEFVRHTDTLALTESNGTKTDHLALGSDLTRTAGLNFSTLALDASSGAVTLDLGGYAFQTDNSALGRGILVNGSNPVTIRGGAHGAQSATYLHNYGTGKFTWALTNSSSCTLVSTGPGLTEITQSVLNTLIISEGVTRLTMARNYAEGALYVFGDGVLEIGADLNGAGAAGDFSRSAGSGAGQIYFVAGGGFSAYGADRTVNLGGAGGAVGWLQPEGKPLVLSSSHANATLILVNPISLSSYQREIRVRNGSAPIDARLTGKIYGVGPASLFKSGDGTLELTGKQDYFGDFSVIGGSLRLGADDVFAGGTNALVLSGATLDAGTGRNAFDTLELLSDSIIAAGNGSASLSFSDSSAKTWTGRLSITGKLGPTTLRFGTDGNGLTAAQLAAITCRGFSVRLDAQGYLLQNPPGTLISVR